MWEFKQESDCHSRSISTLGDSITHIKTMLKKYLFFHITPIRLLTILSNKLPPFLRIQPFQCCAPIGDVVKSIKKQRLNASPCTGPCKSKMWGCGNIRDAHNIPLDLQTCTSVATHPYTPCPNQSWNPNNLAVETYANQYPFLFVKEPECHLYNHVLKASWRRCNTNWILGDSSKTANVLQASTRHQLVLLCFYYFFFYSKVRYPKPCKPASLYPTESKSNPYVTIPKQRNDPMTKLRPGTPSSWDQFWHLCTQFVRLGDLTRLDARMSFSM